MQDLKGPFRKFVSSNSKVEKHLKQKWSLSTTVRKESALDAYQEYEMGCM